MRKICDLISNETNESQTQTRKDKKMKTTPLTRHAHYNAADYAYLKNKGYTDAEIRQMWTRQTEPCRHDKKAFDIVGYLNR